jgi:hypothetical protein
MDRDNAPLLEAERRLVPTVFHEPWWLEAASAGAYREAVATSDGQVVGRLPYLLKQKISRQNVLIMPPMTHVLGPALARRITDIEYPRSLRRVTVTGELIAQLPRASHVWFQLHRGVTDALAFEAAGYSTGVDFTLEIAPDTPEALWRNMRDKTRNVIRRARERLQVGDIAQPGSFLDFYEDNLAQHGRSNRYDRQICEALIGACQSHDAARLLWAQDASGTPHAAICTIRDHAVEYYFMSTRRLDAANGAIHLLIWEVMQRASAAELVFDLDGVDVTGRHHSTNNLLLITGFGGTVKPRYFVFKNSPMYQVARYARSLLESPRLRR